MSAVLALDVGGTKLAAGVVTDDGVLLVDRRCRTDGRGAEDLFGATAALLEEVLSSADELGVDRSTLRALGVGCGGPMADGGELVSPLNIEQWRDFPLRSRLAAWSGLPTFVDNDAKALALGEGWVGAALGERNYLAMVVSTGVGGGIVLDGRLLGGAEGNAGHIGHVIVDPTGRPCSCGARGCLEAQASGTAIAAATGRPPEQATRAERISAGRWVGRAVASVCNLLDLDLAVVAGSVALGFGDVFFDAANDELRRCARLAFVQRARIVPAALGAEAPLVGAAAVALLGLGEQPIAVGVREAGGRAS